MDQAFGTGFSIDTTYSHANPRRFFKMSHILLYYAILHISIFFSQAHSTESPFVIILFSSTSFLSAKGRGVIVELGLYFLLPKTSLGEISNFIDGFDGVAKRGVTGEKARYVFYCIGSLDSVGGGNGILGTWRRRNPG